MPTIEPRTGPYAAKPYPDEMAYLSHLQTLVKSLLPKGSINGEESVEALFDLLLPTYASEVKTFRQRYGDGDMHLAMLRMKGYEFAPGEQEKFSRIALPSRRLSPAQVYAE